MGEFSQCIVCNQRGRTGSLKLPSEENITNNSKESENTRHENKNVNAKKTQKRRRTMKRRKKK